MTKSLALMLAIVLLALTACGGGHSALTPSPGANTAAPANPLAAGLPSLDKLPVPTRQVSLLGPGWYNIPLAEMEGSSGAALNADAIDLAGVAPLSYALYGVCRFDGDNGPTSVKATVSGVTGQYYIGFSDYKFQRWDFAGPFNASAETSLPKMDRHTSVNDFVSPMGASYIVIGIQPGAALTLTKLELGVHGGVKGPLPPTDLSSMNNTPSVRLDWINSLDSTDPDFAGYYIESASLLAGDFVARNAMPQKEDFWIDDTCVAGQQYRYRVCAADASGSRSPWVECTGYSENGSGMGVVAEMRGPHGLLYGPAQVSFNFSGSYSLDGGTISKYDLEFPGGPYLSSTDSPVLSATVQPGCYLIKGTVHTSGSVLSSDNTYSKLIVYPKWQDQPVVVRAAANPGGTAQSRLRFMRGCALPDGNAVLVGYDATAASLAVWQGSQSGTPKLTLLPVENVKSIGEPVQVAANNGYAYFPVFSQGKLDLLVIGPGKPYLQGIWDLGPGTTCTAAASAGDGVLIFINYYDSSPERYGLSWAQMNTQASPFSYSVEISEAVTIFDVVAVPLANALDFVYSTASSTEYIRVDLATGTTTVTAQIADVPVDAIDLELDPASGRPVLTISYSSQHFYRELDGTGTWTPEMEIDLAVTCFAPLDIAYDDGVLYAYFATWPSGVSVRYKYDAGAWTRLSDASFSGDDGYQVALMPLPGDPASLVADVDGAGTVFLAKMTEGSADEVLWQVPATDGQGFELHASTGSDGLHAVWRSELSDRLRHYLSTNGGATWQDADPSQALPLGARGIDLATDGGGGNLWLSYEDGVNSNLLKWDPVAAGFTALTSCPNNGHQRPFLAHGCSTDSIRWEAYDGASSVLNLFSGSVLLPPVDWSAGQVLDGVICGLYGDYDHTRPALISYYDALWGHYLGLLDFGETEIIEILHLAPSELMLSSTLHGRTLASTVYHNGSTPLWSWTDSHPVAFFSSYASGDLPLRYELSKDHPSLTAELPFATPAGADPRRTVSAAMAQGDTGVVLVASLDGSQTLFQWSNFGQWENIPLPQGLARAFQPELVVGTDGRWHILYKDWLTDDLMCWSTL